MKRDFICLYINKQRYEIRGDDAFMPLANYLREKRGLTGTKIVCGEGDCGACTLLVGRSLERKMNGLPKLQFEAINSCIAFVYQLDLCHIITVEGIQTATGLHPIQESFVKNQGAQCGYCTPGFICSLAAMADDLKHEGHGKVPKKQAKNYLTGNLCRCTGYEPIIKAAAEIDLEKFDSLSNRYHKKEILEDFEKISMHTVEIVTEGKKLFLPVSMDEALEIKSENKQARLTSGATDLGVMVNKDKHKQELVLGLQNISECYQIKDMGNEIHIGARATMAKIEKSLKRIFPEFSQLIHIFASHQIKNKATLVGNLANASPIADTVPFLVVAGAMIELACKDGKRLVDIKDFILGYKKLDMREDEIISGIKIAKTKHLFKLYKVSLRKDLDISAVTFAARYELVKGKINEFRLALGGVAATVVRMPEIEKFLQGKDWHPDTFRQASEMISQHISPLSDVRGSKEYRILLCRNLMLKLGDVLPEWSESQVRP